MGKANRGHVIETALWLLFAGFLYYFSFEFDRPIEIYKFGATLWPRVIIFIIVLAALGNFFWHWRYGDEVQGHSIGASAAESESPSADADPDGESKTLAYKARIAGILILPFIYAYFLERIGFYTLTPFFIAGVICLMGERRWIWIVGVSIISYLIILLLFAKILYVGLPVGTIHPFYDYSNWLLSLLQNN